MTSADMDLQQILCREAATLPLQFQQSIGATMISTVINGQALRRAALLMFAGVLGMAVSGCGGGGTASVPSTTSTTPADTSATSFLSYKDPYHPLVDAAGYVQKTAQVNNVSFSYAEGPDNGPPLVLLHAQMLDWYSYSRVLPDLAKSFHVYDIDYQGHGATVTAADYPMTANQIGADLADFITQRIGQAVYVTGNSSGGLLATWLAANRPALVRAVVLEDPPLFSSEYPEIKNTIADRAFATSYTAVTQDHPSDFLLYWVNQNAEFFTNNIGPGSSVLLSAAIVAYRQANPGQPVELGMIQDDTIRMMVRGLGEYDPRFGAAFYDGSWNQGFDHATALAAITCPVLLMQANTTILDDGTVNGAMSQQQADLAMSLLKNGVYMKVDSEHVINLAKPDVFLAAINQFFLGK
jgi:pimeloyl-ACP methyl ester carboxylesterase